MPEAEGEAVQLFVYDLSGGMARAFSQMLLGRTVRNGETGGDAFAYKSMCTNNRQWRTLVALHGSSSFCIVLPAAINLTPWRLIPPSHGVQPGSPPLVLTASLS